MVFVYITCKDKKEANKISKRLLEKRLVACTNIFPIESSYWWKGKIVEDTEIAMFCKTLKGKYEEIKNEVVKIHSYDIPCICLMDAESNEDYDKWMRKEIR